MPHRRAAVARGFGRRPLRVLDAGCGQGTALTMMDPSIHVFGSDISWPMLTDAVRRGPVTLQEPYDLPFADDTFDAAYAFCIYHHIPDADHVRHLSELRRVVRPGGEVMVFEHNPYNPVTARIFARAPIDRGCHMIKPQTLRDTFQAASLKRLDSGYLLFVPGTAQPGSRLRRTGPGVAAVGRPVLRGGPQAGPTITMTDSTVASRATPATVLGVANLPRAAGDRIRPVLWGRQVLPLDRHSARLLSTELRTGRDDGLRIWFHRSPRCTSRPRASRIS